MVATRFTDYYDNTNVCDDEINSKSKCVMICDGNNDDKLQWNWHYHKHIFSGKLQINIEWDEFIYATQ